jgi:branched-chain amino acid transport system ATP-binding protein
MAPPGSMPDQRQALGRLVSAFPFLGERASRPAGQLSGGQRRLVAIARATCLRPRLLLLGEPFLGLAPIWGRRISGAIRAMQRRGTTILMSAQMAGPALRLATCGYVMCGGEVRCEGMVAEIRDGALAAEYL